MNNDRTRQIFVTLSEVACIIGTLVGTGAIGTRVAESSGGSLAADATLLAPAGPAFSIWSVIYLGLLGYTIWQWLPSKRQDPAARATGWLAGISMLLNAGWLLVTQVGLIWLSVLVMAALVVCLGELMRRIRMVPGGAGDAAGRGGRRGLDWLVLDGTFGAYLGWVSVAAAANVTAAAVASGRTLGWLGDQLLAVAVIAVAALIGVWLLRVYGAPVALAAAMAWGLSWIAVGRWGDSPSSLMVGVAAVLAAVLLIVVTLVQQLRRR